MCYGDGFRGGVLLGNLGGSVLACSRLSDSGEDAKVEGTRKVGGISQTDRPRYKYPDIFKDI